jgi:hypothetical protein
MVNFELLTKFGHFAGSKESEMSPGVFYVQKVPIFLPTIQFEEIFHTHLQTF